MLLGMSVDRRLFHRCGASVDLDRSCLETLLSLEVKGSSEGILYDEIYIMIIEKLLSILLRHVILINFSTVTNYEHYL